jgi:hypothetical protein
MCEYCFLPLLGLSTRGVLLRSNSILQVAFHALRQVQHYIDIRNLDPKNTTVLLLLPATSGPQLRPLNLVTPYNTKPSTPNNYPIHHYNNISKLVSKR